MLAQCQTNQQYMCAADGSSNYAPEILARRIPVQLLARSRGGITMWFLDWAGVVVCSFYCGPSSDHWCAVLVHCDAVFAVEVVLGRVQRGKIVIHTVECFPFRLAYFSGLWRVFRTCHVISAYCIRCCTKLATGVYQQYAWGIQTTTTACSYPQSGMLIIFHIDRRCR